MSYPDPATEKGLCQCGCGQPTKIARWNRADRGWVLGQPMRFLYGHGRGGLREFWLRVDKSEGGCWEWTGRKNKKGYGTVSDFGRRRHAHLYLWEKLRGPVPDGLELDHLCRNRACVNPDHLEVVTHRENMRRGRWPNGNGRNYRKEEVSVLP